MVVYVEVLIGENFLMNYIVAFLTAKLLVLNVKYINLLLCAGFGCAYCVLLYPLEMNFLDNIIAKIIFSFFMCFCLCKEKSVKNIAKTFFGLYLVTIIFGGTLMLCASLLGINLSLSGGTLLSGISFSYLLLIFFVLITGIFYIIKIAKKVKLKKSFIYDVVILNGGKTAEFKGFLDSGNNICDALGNGGIVIEKTIADKINAKEEDRTLQIKTVCGTARANCATAEKIIILGKNPKTINYPFLIIYDGVLSKNGEYSALLNLNNMV